ncbi:hypothetical protein [Ferruginibacter sp.]
MDLTVYTQKFKNALGQMDKTQLGKLQLEAAVGIVLDSVFLKLYKKTWVNDMEDPLNAATRIFFSVWINEKTAEQNRVYYNIHAFKLRQLKGYDISSRDFAEQFRKKFRKVQQRWQNVSVQYGPLTLMEGWVELDAAHIEQTVKTLAVNFMQIAHLVDDTLKAFEQKKNSRLHKKTA